MRLLAEPDHSTVEMACKLFGVTKQAWYKNNDHSIDRAAREDMVIQYVKEIRLKDPGMGGRKLWQMYRKHYGSKITVGRDCFEHILSCRGLTLRKPRQHPRTTDSRHDLPKYPNLVKSLIPDHPNQVWVSDITYQVICPEKNSSDCDFVYLSLITDAYTKSIKGWSVGDTLETKYPLIALKMALRQTGTENIKGLIHHSDRGVQYASFEYVELLKKYGISISMTESGDPKDNAIAERSNETLKDELFKGLVFRNIEEVRQAMQKAVDFYNNERPHMSLGGLTPSHAMKMNGAIPKQWFSYREKAIKGVQNHEKMLTSPDTTPKMLPAPGQGA